MDEEEQLPSGEMAYPQLYDFFKHLSTLSLISIGGILGLLRDDTIELPIVAILMSLGAIGATAFLTITTNANIATSTIGGKKRLSLSMMRRYAGFAMTLFTLGIGIFTGSFATELIANAN